MGFEPMSQWHILGHAKILFVNSTMISRRIRFKAISSLSDAFSMLLRVANPLKYIKRLERLKISLYFIVHCPVWLKGSCRIYSHSWYTMQCQHFDTISCCSTDSWFVHRNCWSNGSILLHRADSVCSPHVTQRFLWQVSIHLYIGTCTLMCNSATLPFHYIQSWLKGSWLGEQMWD